MIPEQKIKLLENLKLEREVGLRLEGIDRQTDPVWYFIMAKLGQAMLYAPPECPERRLPITPKIP